MKYEVNIVIALCTVHAQTSSSQHFSLSVLTCSPHSFIELMISTEILYLVQALSPVFPRLYPGPHEPDQNKPEDD